MAKSFSTINLPSKCLVYPEVDPGSISICQLTGEEERLLSEVSTSNLDRKVLEVLKNVVQGIDVSILTTGDRLFLLIWEIMNSFSDEIPVSYLCYNCEKKVDITGKFSTMDVIELPDDFKQPYPVTLSDETVVKLRLLTAGDEVLISDYESSGEDAWCYRYALSIVSDDDILRRVKFYQDLPVKDTAKIRAFQEKFFHGPSMEFPCKCPHCGEEELVSIPFRIEFLFPSGEELVRNYGIGVSSDVVSKDE